MGKVVQMRISDSEARKRIKAVAQDSGKVSIPSWSHAGKRQKSRGITRRQILKCLQAGRFTEPPCWDQIHGNFKFTMQTVVAGDKIHVAAALDKDENGDYIIVVTVF